MNVRMLLVLNFVVALFSVGTVFASCDCGLTIPKELRINKPEHAVGYTRYDKDIQDAYGTKRFSFEDAY